MHDKNKKLPGEAAFAFLLLALSLWLAWEAYGISKFRSLSAPGSFPMAVTAIMVVTSVLIFLRTLRLPAAATMRNWREILPMRIVLMALLIAGFAMALRPVGFLPSALVFLTLSIKYLHKRSWAYSLGVSFLSLAFIYIVFRLIFTVLMPEGIVPEREMIAYVRNLFGGWMK
jgi:putative tricarboxylic transport membrane protein